MKRTTKLIVILYCFHCCDPHWMSQQTHTCVMATPTSVVIVLPTPCLLADIQIIYNPVYNNLFILNILFHIEDSINISNNCRYIFVYYFFCIYIKNSTSKFIDIKFGFNNFKFYTFIW